MKKVVSKLCLWVLAKVGYELPVVRPVTVDIRDCQRVRCQEVLTYHQLAMAGVDVKEYARRAVKERMVYELLPLIEVVEEPTVDGLVVRCDALVANFPNVNIANNQQ